MTVAFVRLRLLNFPLERDEGEYAYAGQLILQGIPPYELAYNMKFPGTYLAYAFIMALFGQTPAGTLFGAAILMKQHAIIIAAWAFMALGVQNFQKTRKFNLRHFTLPGIFGLGAALPFLLCCGWLVAMGVFGKFWFWTIKLCTRICVHQFID